MDNKIFQSNLVNLHQIEKFSFVIPSYQRPYVWTEIEVKKILSDFYKAYQKDRQSNYYIGTILTKESTDEAELIDGQQRFTTLWLVAFVFWTKNSGSELENILRAKDGKLKMSFEIRTEVANYLSTLIDKKETTGDAILNTNNHPYLKNIARALTTIQSLIDEEIEESQLKDFGNYIYYQVHLIKNTTPAKLDLNKLFSTINSAGVQLEQTDIVKSNLLNLIDDKILYGRIWEACEDMTNFFERNVRTSFPKSNWKNIDLSKYMIFDKSIFIYESTDILDESEQNFTLDSFELDTLETYKSFINDYENEKRDSELIYCRSIINFGQLLLHTYRLHLLFENKPDFEGTFHVNRLIEIFSALKNPAEIKRFIELLWTVRYHFDKYIVKWISDNNSKNESLELLNINKNSENYYTRTAYDKSGMLMLQSVLYFTGDYLRQFWLTPYLYCLIKNKNNPNAQSNTLLIILEKLDNQLSISELQDKEATFKLCTEDLNPDFDFEKYLKENSYGTKFKHYWFQKLEYVLWKTWPENNKTNKFNNFRITSKNSIEHIYPQNPENRIQHPNIEKDVLDSFGNLVLLSVSQNSEYSNKSVAVKRSMFNEKQNSYDTLKSFYIFKNDTDWTAEAIDSHKTEMINILKQHYKNKGLLSSEAND
ncbi:MAG: DUF262 domain-containing protein [Flavobacteriales bacterium]|nr:DUF262 domain-containing protein [Flavobacteriales bacterium]